MNLIWILLTGLIIVAYGTIVLLGLNYLFLRRTYREFDGRLFVRHGRLGKWVDVKEHLAEEHPDILSTLQKGLRGRE